jgi:AraC-like DNA-binding protein
VQHVSIVPKPPLAEFVERLWFSDDIPSHQKVRVAPTATMELVFNLDDDELGFYDTEQPRSCNVFSGSVFSGAHTGPLFIDTRAHVMGVHFKPGGAFRFLGVPGREIANTHVDLEALWGRLAQDLREQLLAAANPARRFRVLENALATRLENTLGEHRAVRAALEIFARDAGEAKIRDLAAHLGLSQRHFIRVFSDQVGVTPKQFGRVQRFQRALHLAQSCDAPDWADIAAICGYFDQSHLIHDFQLFSGLSPTEFHRGRNEGVLMNPPSPNRSIFSNTELNPLLDSGQNP